jgi:hypothetical protein
MKRPSSPRNLGIGGRTDTCSDHRSRLPDIHEARDGTEHLSRLSKRDGLDFERCELRADGIHRRFPLALRIGWNVTERSVRFLSLCRSDLSLSEGFFVFRKT